MIETSWMGYILQDMKDFAEENNLTSLEHDLTSILEKHPELTQNINYFKGTVPTVAANKEKISSDNIEYLDRHKELISA